MEEILKIDTVCQYNDLFGFETKHPQVAMMEFKDPTTIRNYRMTVGFYGIFLKETKGCVIDYGRSKYDYDDQTVVSYAPGQTIGFTHIEGVMPKAVGLIFHPDFIRGTSLGEKIKRYEFFSYASNEALHLSAEERRVIQSCLEIIRTELNHAIDRHTRTLICTNIELLLDYCLRFYDRQFITRQDVNLDVLSRFERLVMDYLNSDKLQRYGIPQVQYFADQVNLSTNYFSDLVRKETGKGAKEYIQQSLLRLAKSELANPDYNISEVSDRLGFQYPQHFIRFFKRNMGLTPTEYRKSIFN